MRFVGRSQELAALERAYRAPRAGLIPVWGRRRVGKSTLLRHFLHGKPGLYFLAKQTRGEAQLKEFLAAAAVATGQSILTELTTNDWKGALLRTVELWRADRVILVLDELQYLAGAVQGLASILQECWDLYWKDGGKVVLVLCGSEIGFMEREVLGKKSPLFGRRSGQIHLEPFSYAEAAEFHPSWSYPQKACAYFVCGGIPMYLEQLDADLSLRRNIEELFLSPTGTLAYEADFLLREELRDVHNYHAVLLAVAAHHGTPAAIARASGVPEGSLKYYLKQLMNLGYVATHHPLFDKRPKRGKQRYVLDDALLRFWFRFISDRTSVAHQYGPRAAYDSLKQRIEAYWGSCFERLCREALPFIYRREGVAAGFQIGEYWDNAVQIDVVGLRDDGWTDLGECKWQTVRSAAKVARELEQKVPLYPNARNATIGRRLFFREPPRREVSGVRTHGLEDIYEVAS